MTEPEQAVDRAAPAGARGEPVDNAARCPLPPHRPLGQPSRVAPSGWDNRKRLPPRTTTSTTTNQRKGGLNTPIQLCYQLYCASVASNRPASWKPRPTSTGMRVRHQSERASGITGIGIKQVLPLNLDRHLQESR